MECLPPSSVCGYWCAQASKPGTCGEHGGDTDSVQLCHQLGLNHVSCSPRRVPAARHAAARHAAARAVIEEKRAAKK